MLTVKHLPKAQLVLADGSVFSGVSIGANGFAVGEVVFNTAMTGYQEILTDPSYAEQIVTLTYPHIGNTGVNPEDMESEHVWAKGLVIRDLSLIMSNWRATQSLPEFLLRHNVVAIADIDTRRLTRHLREHGAQNACIIVGEDIDQALSLAKDFAGLDGLDLAKTVTCQQPYSFSDEGSKHIVCYDFGVKQNILRIFKAANCKVTVVPAKTAVADVLALQPDAVFLSNGPGDPAACDYAIANTKELIAKQIPLFGICLGCQILGLALGAKTFKMKFGHHGANHPVQDLRTKQVLITSQNHGFAIDENTMPATLAVTHRSLFDQTVQGIKHQQQPILAFQGHPEASPGPHDMMPLFSEFLQMLGD